MQTTSTALTHLRITSHRIHPQLQPQPTEIAAAVTRYTYLATSNEPLPIPPRTNKLLPTSSHSPTDDHIALPVTRSLTPLYIFRHPRPLACCHHYYALPALNPSTVQPRLTYFVYIKDISAPLNPPTMNSMNQNTNTNGAGADQRDYLDKGLDAAEKKYGGSWGQNTEGHRAMNEKIVSSRHQLSLVLRCR
jgi:hypothetical protein